ncbi:hypothetical protein BDZ89DRAFT_1113778 [Hymenopellis radicata]|nr:hypothetical protein BDZ89DRAFT_1113778 [Hymenopellis radicata]
MPQYYASFTPNSAYVFPSRGDDKKQWNGLIDAIRERAALCKQDGFVCYSGQARQNIIVVNVTIKITDDDHPTDNLLTATSSDSWSFQHFLDASRTYAGGLGQADAPRAARPGSKDDAFLLVETFGFGQSKPIEHRKKIVYGSRSHGGVSNGGRLVTNEDELLDAIPAKLDERGRGEELVLFHENKFGTARWRTVQSSLNWNGYTRS